MKSRAQSRAWRIFEAAKPAVQALRRDRHLATFFIFGCQRSGTTHLERLFRSDPRSTVYGEFSVLSIEPEKTFWRPMPDIARTLTSHAGTYAVARSLLFSHRAREALDAVSPSIGVWMFRDAESVVDSMIRKWGPAFRAISERVETDTEGAWQLRGLWDEIEREADAIGSQGDGRVRDVYALYWQRRNQSLFEGGLAGDGRMILLDYADLVADPKAAVGRILGKGGVPSARIGFPQRTRNDGRLSRGPEGLSPPVREACDRLLCDLRREAARCR
jgi:hypothetical protein